MSPHLQLLDISEEKWSDTNTLAYVKNEKKSFVTLTSLSIDPK
jgi:hypothetical protein